MLPTKAQKIVGDWKGNLTIQGMELPLIIHITEQDGQLQATMDSPKQAAFGLPISSIEQTGDQVILNAAAMQMKIEAQVKGDTMEGTFQQGPLNTPITLVRSQKEVIEKTPTRPQDPKAPFPYKEEEVKFPNVAADNIQLAGTITAPKGVDNPAVVILISGSGPQNRNSEILNHRPFWVWADHLSRNGMAVLRYDERGIAESEGDFSTATSEDFASDVTAAIQFIKGKEGFQKSKIILMGHSEGGIIAPMVANQNKEVNMVVLLAGPTVPTDQMMLLQNEKFIDAQGVTGFAKTAYMDQQKALFELIKESGSLSKEEMEDQLFKFYEERNGGMNLRDNPQVKQGVAQMSSPWMRFFLAYDPTDNLKALQCPILAINGDKDLQVVAEQNIPAAEKALKAGGNKDYEVKIFPNLNHLFQKAEKGTVDEYASIEESVNPEVLEYVTKWLLARI